MTEVARGPGAVTMGISRWRLALLTAFALASALGGSAVAAQESPPAIPDAASVTVPDISTSDPDVLSQGYKFFIFHRPSVGYEEAYADIAECRSFLPAGPGRTLPGFTPWVAAPPPRRPVQGANPYGLVGDAILAIILPKMVRGQDNTIMRRCMETRGYVRFAVAEDLLDDLNEGEESMITARLARLASGPRPTQPEVSE